MLRFATKPSEVAGLQTAAMTDIIFLLLIFFLLSSSFIMRTEIPLTPPSSTSNMTSEDKPVVVAVDEAGNIFVEEDKVTLEGLQSALGARLRDNPTKAVLVRGDKSVALGRLVEVMDAAQGAGALKLAIATRPKR